MLIVCISGSPRRGGNTDFCIDYVGEALAEGSEAEVERHYLSEVDIGPCRGCRACMRAGQCVIEDDDFPLLWDRVMAADLLVLAAPVYWLGPPGLMKNLIDRAHGVYALAHPLAGKRAYFISVAADSGFDTHEEIMASWVRHYGARILGEARVLARDLGEAEKSTEAAEELEKVVGAIRRSGL